MRLVNSLECTAMGVRVMTKSRLETWLLQPRADIILQLCVTTFPHWFVHVPDLGVSILNLGVKPQALLILNRFEHL
jgi:hypothetical protein